MSLDNIVNLDNVSIFQHNYMVLSNISLNIEKGEFLYLIGKTGSGKSSLLKVLYGENKVSHGTGKVAGFDLNTLSSKEIPFLRRKLGIVFQDFQLLTDRNVYENLRFVLQATGWDNKEAIHERIHNVLEKVGLQSKSLKMPNTLSGGEQQRIAIARALLNDPELILADEPTGNLDPDTSEDIMKLLFEISKNGRAIIMATHNYAIIERFPSRVIMCGEGKLQEMMIQGL